MATYKNNEQAALILERIKEAIEREGGIIKREHLSEMGIDYRRVLDYVERKELIRVRNGYYTDRIDRFSEEELVAIMFPDAVLCMESALYAYGYIEEKPFAWKLAVDKNTSKSRFLMEYPKIIPYYTQADALSLGVSQITLGKGTFAIYDKERLICDCLKYESKMDRTLFQSAIQSYIKDDDKDLMALMEYARARKVVKKVQSLIGVWL